MGEGGENIISIVAGSNFAIDASDVARGRAALESAKVLLLQLEVPLAASLEAAAIVRKAGGIVILDPAPAPKDGLTPEILRAVDIITPNETEAGLILGWQPKSLEDGLKAAKELRARGVSTAVVKLGSRGLAVASKGPKPSCPPSRSMPSTRWPPATASTAGLDHALESGMPLLDALRYAAACGALSTTRKGASAAAPTKDEVAAFLSRA